MIQLTSRWGKEVTADNVLQEYPRPNMVRNSYINLNGEWEYCINKSEYTKQYDGKILVPFSPESKLSGVGKIVQPDDVLHYRKKFILPEGFCKERVLLHFGAVDQECKVFVNEKLVGDHVGGYLPFEFDITQFLKDGENILTLCVKDYTEQAPYGRGKQKLKKKGKYSSLFYTPQSGIWKTVWMKSVEAEYIQSIKITPLYDEKAIRIMVGTNGATPAEVRVLDRDKNIIKETIVESNKECLVEIGDFVAWTTQNPYLYDVQICVGKDMVVSYFGMRKYSVEKDKNGILRFYMNNKPFIFNGVLDQGYWPESLLTAPADEALK